MHFITTLMVFRDVSAMTAPQLVMRDPVTGFPREGHKGIPDVGPRRLIRPALRRSVPLDQPGAPDPPTPPHRIRSGPLVHSLLSIGLQPHGASCGQVSRSRASHGSRKGGALSMRIDFESDLVGIARQELGKAKVAQTLLLPDRDALVRFFVLQHRLLPPGPYEVEMSEEAVLSFALAREPLRVGILGLLSSAKRGASLWHYQSRRLIQGRFPPKMKPQDPEHDMLLNDWGIHHLHLGTKFDADGFAERTDTLAFVTIRDRTMFVIDFRPHSSSWSCIELLGITDRKWPRLLSVINGVLPSKEPWSEKRHQELRSAGLYSPVELNGRMVMPSGSAYATSGHSTSAIMRMDLTLQRLLQMEDFLKEGEASLQQAEQQGELEVHLQLGVDGRFEVISNGRRLLAEDGRGLAEKFGL